MLADGTQYPENTNSIRSFSWTLDSSRCWSKQNFSNGYAECDDELPRDISDPYGVMITVQANHEHTYEKLFELRV